MRTKGDVCNWKVEIGVFQFALDASLLDPRCPLGHSMSLHTYTTHVNGVVTRLYKRNEKLLKGRKNQIKQI